MMAHAHTHAHTHPHTHTHAHDFGDSLDVAAVVGAQGTGATSVSPAHTPPLHNVWGAAGVMLSPTDVFSSAPDLAFDELLKPPAVAVSAPAPAPVHSQPQPVPLAPAPAPAPVSVSASVPATHSHSRSKVPGGRVRKTRARMTRAEEELCYGALTDIGGSTAARSRQMTEEERRVMLYKRKLRNRASAARSREKRCRTMMELSTDLAALLERSERVHNDALKVAQDNAALRAENNNLREQVRKLSLLLHPHHQV